MSIGLLAQCQSLAIWLNVYILGMKFVDINYFSTLRLEWKGDLLTIRMSIGLLAQCQSLVIRLNVYIPDINYLYNNPFYLF